MRSLLTLFTITCFLLICNNQSLANPTDSCNLQVNIKSNSANANVELSKLRLVNFNSFKTVKAKTKNGSKTFKSLKKGLYRIQVEKDDFKTVFKRIYLTCEKELLVEDISMHVGKSNEKVFLLEDDYNLTTSNEIFFDEGINIIGVSMPRPSYPKRCSSECNVKVLILIDEQGNVIGTKALSGQEYLHKPTETAARNSKFLPVIYKGKPTKVKGIMKYSFN